MTARVVAYAASGELFPIYAVYPLLFSDHGLSSSDISLLFVAWSLSGFAFEVPSGAWADAFDRRRLLAFSGLVQCAAYTSWMLWPTLPGFLIGFVLWGLAGATRSGTFEALLYDELAATGRQDDYVRLRGLAEAAGVVAALLAIGSAGWLMQVGGYSLVGWLSVGMALAHTGLACALPRARPVDVVGEPESYFTLLRAGLREAARTRPVRQVVVVSAAMVGLTAIDEYFPLVGAEQGLSPSQVPWMFTLLMLGQAAGTALAGKAAVLPVGATAASYAVGAVALSAGLLTGSWPGYVVAAVGYGLLSNAYLVAEARLQEAIEGSARATVTSVAGISEEVFSVLAFGAVGVGAGWWSTTTVVAAFAIPLLVTSLVATRWLPSPARARGD